MVFFAVLLVCGCAGTRTGRGVAPGAGRIFSAFGEVSGMLDGEKFRMKVSIADTEGRGFACRCYDPFGATALAITANADSAGIVMGDTTFAMVGATVAGLPVPLLHAAPFTFAELKRILCGMPPFEMAGRATADSIWQSKNDHFALWRDSTKQVVRVTHGSSGQMLRMSIRGAGEPAWNLLMDRFQGAYFRQIRFDSGAKNYFVLRLDRKRLY
jgi:hypothetical protein